MLGRYRLGFEYWRDSFRASDPGLDRLRIGARAAVTVGLSLTLLFILAPWLGQELATGLPGVVIAMFGVILVNDDTIRAQKITLLLLAIPALGVFVLGTLLASDPLLNGVGFIGVILASVISRRYGARGLALGMVGVLSYIFALFLNVGVADFPWIFAATVLSLACAYAVRFWLFREGKWRFVWARRAMLSRTNMLLRLLEYAASGDGNPAEKWKRARPLIIENLERLNAAALRVEDAWLVYNEHASKLSRVKSNSALDYGPHEVPLPRWIFAVEMVAERVTVNLRRILTMDEDDPEVRREIVAALREARPVIDAARGRDRKPTTPRLEALIKFSQVSRHEPLRRFAVALDDVAKIVFWDAYEVELSLEDARVLDPFSPMSPAPEVSIAPDEASGEGPEAERKREIRANTREAVQAVLAGTLAILAGHLVSPTRWYWAVIASFVIFIRTGSRGHIMIKGAQRVLGTLIGVAVGLGLVMLVEGHMLLELSLIFVAIFVGYYLAQVSYTWMISAVTVQIGVLYALMGRPVRDVLMVRFQETLLGVIIGVVVAVLVLPTRTRPKIHNRMALLLEECAGYFEASAVYMRKKSADIFIKQRSRKLTRSLQQLREAARPMRGRLVLVKAVSVNYELMLLGVLVYQARNLAASAEPSNPDLSDGLRESIAERAERLGRLCRGLARALRFPDERAAAGPENQPRYDADGDEVRLSEPFDLPDEPGERLPPSTVAINALRAAEKIAREFGRALDSDESIRK
ncbi:FUSC family protein [Bradymonas sediminis]|uniref:Uncharacterized protein n=1 Tax=Bradymonas sediminis TaxID=1548548 RepID=A0A2Z4FHW5_9DELT|nr:FUSC family protein [Bradymonas sediminis]AWV88591.1 hypothetical protein DN745_04255 [Bradymonas sediminis]TDP77735.1 fusaric acid resistance family protein [Bradymonas sediminis]